MIRQAVYKTLFLGLGILFAAASFAQKDTTKKGGIDIISSFKPVLREAAKINFNASPPSADTTKAKLSYDIPNQNLLFAYQPGSLKPLALDVDSVAKFNNSSYVKVGFGSLRTPFVQAGISFGDGKSLRLSDSVYLNPTVRSNFYLMYKSNSGEYPTDRGWVYGVVSSDGKTVLQKGLVASCMKCHSQSKTDRMLGAK